MKRFRIIITLVTLCLAMVFVMSASASAEWEITFTEFGDEVAIEYEHEEESPPPIYGYCDESEPYRVLCDEELGGPDCTQNMYKNLRGLGIVCHMRMAYISSVTGQREVMDWFSSDDPTIAGSFNNTNFGYRQCEFIDGETSGSVIKGYNSYHSQTWNGPWIARFRWNPLCDRPIKILVRFDDEGPPDNPY